MKSHTMHIIKNVQPNVNTKSISVETCVEKDGKIHGDTVQNAAELIAYHGGWYLRTEDKG